MAVVYAGQTFEGATWDGERRVYAVKESEVDLIEVVPLIYTAALVLTPKENTMAYYDRWCYHSLEAAIAAAQAWDPETQDEPQGWHRHPPSGRRRPDGDPAQEYVNY